MIIIYYVTGLIFLVRYVSCMIIRIMPTDFFSVNKLLISGFHPVHMLFSEAVTINRLINRWKINEQLFQ